jgi:hypothetical protein
MARSSPDAFASVELPPRKTRDGRYLLPLILTNVGHKLATAAKLPPASLLRVAEAALFLALARLAVIALPFRLLVTWMRRSPDNSPANKTEHQAGGDPSLLLAVREAVEIAARNVPFNAVCLPQAMAAKAMLARRGCGSACHFGAHSGKDGKFIAHAWLMVGDKVVVGGAGIAQVTPLARFG